MNDREQLLHDLKWDLFQWSVVGSTDGAMMYEANYHGVRLGLVTDGKIHTFSRQMRNGRWSMFDTADELLESFPKLHAQ